LVPTLVLEQLAAFEIAPWLMALIASFLGAAVFGLIAWGVRELSVDSQPVAIITFVHASTFLLRFLAVLIGIEFLASTVLYVSPITATVTWAALGYLCLVNESRIGGIATAAGYTSFGVALLSVVGMFVLVMGGEGTGLTVFNVIRDIGRAAGGVILGLTLLAVRE